MSVPPEQEAAAPQLVPAEVLAQAPLPAQRPVWPQGIPETTAHMASAVPSGTIVQVPLVLVRLHAMQVPVQALLQQTPSAQKPDVQSVFAMQIMPLANVLPHRLFWVLHVAPAQSAFEAQLVAHWGAAGGLTVTHLL